MVDTADIDNEFGNCLRIAKKCGLKGNDAIRHASDLCFEIIGVNPLELLGIKVENMLEFDKRMLDDKCKLALTMLKGVNVGVKSSDIPKTMPFMNWTRKERCDVLECLGDNGLIETVKIRHGERGPGAKTWVVCE